MDNPLFRASRAPVLEAFVPHLARINPLFTPRWIQESWLFTAPFAQPIVTVDYRHHIPPFETPVEGLYVANMFQVYPHDRGQNYSVALAERLVQALSTGVDSNVTAELEAAIPGRTPAGASGDPRR
jgi:hypothetical protein